MSMASPIDTSLESVVWKKTLNEKVRDYPQLVGEEEADVVIVGGGYCGLNAAIHAAKSGAKVVLVEAGRIGNGASGRNGGYNVPHFPGAVSVSAVESILGKRKGRALAELVLNGAQAVFQQAQEFQINCSAVQNGWVQPAHSQASLSKVRKVFDEWKAFGAGVNWLSASDISDLTGASGYVGGWSNESGGTVNPYGLAIGLGRAAHQVGVRIFEHSPIDAIEDGPNGCVVKCQSGQVRGSTVIVATNAYTGDFLPQVQRSVVPVYLYHAATKPLRPELREQVLKSGMCFTDLRKSGGFGRLDPEGRFVSGGAVFALGSGMRSYGERHARKRMRLLFPQFTEEDSAIESYWEGYCAVTDSFLPHLQRIGPNSFAVVGFSTRGVNLAQNLGRVVGEFAAGKRSLDQVPVETFEGRKDIAYWPVKVRVARMIFPYYQAKDRLGLS